MKMSDGFMIQEPSTYVWLARNKGMDPYSSPCPIIVVSMFVSILNSQLTKGKSNHWVNNRDGPGLTLSVDQELSVEILDRDSARTS